MTTTLTAPSSIAPGTTVILPDGSSTTVDANSQVVVDVNFVSALLNAGYSLPGSGAADSTALSRATASNATNSTTGSAATASLAAASAVTASLAASALIYSSVASRTKASFSW